MSGQSSAALPAGYWSLPGVDRGQPVATGGIAAGQRHASGAQVQPWHLHRLSAWESGLTTTSVRYFTSTRFSPPALLRRTDMTDEAFDGGAWRPTRSIVAFLFGHDDLVTEITEDEARTFAPAAF